MFEPPLRPFCAFTLAVKCETTFEKRKALHCIFMWSPTKKAHREILTSAAIKSCGHSAMENTSLRLKTILLYPAHKSMAA